MYIHIYIYTYIYIYVLSYWVGYSALRIDGTRQKDLRFLLRDAMLCKFEPRRFVLRVPQSTRTYVEAMLSKFVSAFNS